MEVEDPRPADVLDVEDEKIAKNDEKAGAPTRRRRRRSRGARQRIT